MKKLFLVSLALIASLLLSFGTIHPQTYASSVESIPCNIKIPPKGLPQDFNRKPGVVVWRENHRFCYVTGQNGLFNGVQVNSRVLELESYLNFASVHSLELRNRLGKTRYVFNPVEKRNWGSRADVARYEKDISDLAGFILEKVKPGDVIRRAQGGSGSCCICVTSDVIVSVDGEIVRLDQEILHD